MKKIFLILNIVFITSCSSQIKNIEKQTFKYNHKIKDFKNLENIRSDFSPSTSNNYVIYNKENDTIEIGANNIDGSFLFKKKNEYNIAGKKTKSNDISKSNTLFFQNLYFYNSANLLIESTHTNVKNNILVSKKYYEYDVNGREIKVTAKRNNGDILYRVEKMYDTTGNLVDYKRYDWTKKLSDWYQYKFDNKRIIEKKELDSLNNVKQKYNYKYELNENTHKIQEFLNDKLVTTSIYKDSLLIEKHRIYHNEKVYYKYLFDKHNNWVKMLYFSNNKEYTHLTERKITYE